MSDYTISIVIPNYNGRYLLEKNLPSLIMALGNQKNHICEIILVDDASVDDSVDFVKKNFPQVKIIRHKINRGFASTVNTGVRASRGKLICLLNTDVFVEVDFLESVPNHFKDPKVFGVSLHERGYAWAKGFFKDGFIVHEQGDEDRNVHETFWVSGGSGVFRRNLWIKLGGFDEKLFKFYWEDVDISYRAMKRGYKLFWDPDAKVFHEHESTTAKTFSKSKMRRMQEINQLIFIWKNLTSPTLFKKHLFGLLNRISAHPGYLRIVLGALLNLKRIRKVRQREKKEAKVSDEAIFSRFL